jgi:hypothetical protein
MTVKAGWVKSSRSENGASCVELATSLDRVRDSKNPHGPVLRVDVPALLASIKGDRFAR